jgi:hypothetical protein
LAQKWSVVRDLGGSHHQPKFLPIAYCSTNATKDGSNNRASDNPLERFQLDKFSLQLVNLCICLGVPTVNRYSELGETIHNRLDSAVGDLWKYRTCVCLKMGGQGFAVVWFARVTCVQVSAEILCTPSFSAALTPCLRSYRSNDWVPPRLPVGSRRSFFRAVAESCTGRL